MNFNEFCTEVKNRLDERLANRKVSTDIEKFNAVNKNYTGLRVTYTDSKLSPVFNLTSLYTQVNSDNDLESLINYLYEEVENYESLANRNNFNDTELDFDENSLFFKMFGMENNFELLEKIPYRIVADGLAISYGMECGPSPDGIFTYTITNSLMEEFNLTEEELYQKAIENMPKLYPHLIDDLSFIFEDGGILTLTNNEFMFGASSILYPGVAEEISERFGNSNFFIIPSSLHELIIIADNGQIDTSGINNVIKSVNSELPSKDFLSNTLYYYDCITKKIVPAASIYPDDVVITSSNKLN